MGMARLGFARSPERPTPASTPVTAGKNTAKTTQKPPSSQAPWTGTCAGPDRSAPRTSPSSDKTMSPMMGSCSLSASTVLRPATSTTPTTMAAAAAWIWPSVMPGTTMRMLSASP